MIHLPNRIGQFGDLAQTRNHRAHSFIRQSQTVNKRIVQAFGARLREVFGVFGFERVGLQLNQIRHVAQGEVFGRGAGTRHRTRSSAGGFAEGVHVLGDGLLAHGVSD